MKSAVVHDYFTQQGGAEQVAMHLFHLMPNADLFAAVSIPEQVPVGLRHVPVNTSWMQRLPNLDRYYRQYFLLYPLGIEALDLSSYDLIVSSSSGYGKGVRARRDALHICYCHTPMRWAWRFGDYSEREEMGLLKRTSLSLVLGALRRWDLGASREPDHFIANSKTVAERILRTYGRHAEVIHPPINVDRFRPAQEQHDYYLILSRLISYKRIDLAIEACKRLGRELLIIGEGPDRKRLEMLAGKTIRFAGRLPDLEVEYHASRCRALLFPGEEDFGMVPLEVAAAGRPTVAFYGGGAMETIIDGVTGLFFTDATPESLAEAILRLEGMRFSQRMLVRHAQSFTIDAFEYRFRSFLARVGVELDAAEEVSLPAARPPDFSRAVASHT